MTSNFTFDPPGFQNDFQPGEEGLAQLLRSRWNEDVNRLTERIMQNEPWNFTKQPALFDYYNPRTTDVPKGAAVVPITWTTYPNRIKFTFPGVSRRQHWQYADNGVPDPNYEPKGPRGWQDEYAEWSVTRNAEGQITKVTFTSETREYWYALWDVAPNIVLRLYKQLISEQVKLEDLYLRDASGNPIIDPQTGRPAYNELNEWNNKATGGLAHLIGTFNSQQGAMFLGAQSTILRQDEQGNAIVDASQLINWGLHGTDNRNSDPFISARVNDLVRSGVSVTLKNPVGIYLQEPNFGTYELPFEAAENAKPSDYWKVIRGRKRQAGENYDLILHAVYEVPPEHGFTVSDISIGGFPIEFGAQIAETMQVAVIGEGIPKSTPPLAFGRVASNNLPYPALLREVDLLKVAERSNLNMRIKQGTTIENIALKARNSDRDATIEFVDAPGITVKKTDFREEDGSQIFILTITAAADAPPGNRSLLLKNANGDCGPERFGMLEVVPTVKQWVLTTNGRDHCVGIKDPFVNTTDFTISLWIKPTVLNDGQWHGFIGKFTDGYYKPSLWQSPDNNGLYYTSFNASGESYKDQLNNFFVAKDQWVHITWVKEKTEYRFYRNGELFATKIAPESFYTNRDTNYWIGGVRTCFVGHISDVRIWSHARKSDEIKGDMNQRLTGKEPGLVGYWPLNDCSGSIVVDKSSTGNNGTIDAGPWQQQELPIMVE